MAYDTWAFPHSTEFTFNMITSDGVILRRKRFNRALPLRKFLIRGVAHTPDEAVQIRGLLEPLFCSVIPQYWNLPEVGNVLVRLAQNSFSFVWLTPKLANFTLEFVEEPRPYA